MSFSGIFFILILFFIVYILGMLTTTYFLDNNSHPTYTNNTAPVNKKNNMKVIQEAIQRTEKIELEKKVKKEFEERLKQPEPPKPKTVKEMIKERDNAKSTIYTDPTESLCVNSRADCDNISEGCYIKSGYFEYQECLAFAEEIESEIERFNNKFPINDNRRRREIKFISWAPAGISKDVKKPMCLLYDNTANVKVGEEGWKTYVRNPQSFTMTVDPNVYMIEDICPTVKSKE